MTQTTLLALDNSWSYRQISCNILWKLANTNITNKFTKIEVLGINNLISINKIPVTITLRNGSENDKIFKTIL